MKRIILVLALVLLVALPVFAQEVTVEDLNTRLAKLEMWTFGGLYMNYSYLSIPNSAFQSTTILTRFTAKYTNGDFVAYFRLNKVTYDGTFPTIAWDRWYVQYNFGFMTLQVGKFTVYDTLQPEMFYTFESSGANIKDAGSNGNNGFGFNVPVGPATIHMVIPTNLSWASGSEAINIHTWVDGTIAEMANFIVGVDYDMNYATAIWAGFAVTPIEMLTIGANFAYNSVTSIGSAWELLWNITVIPTEDITIYYEGAYRSDSLSDEVGDDGIIDTFSSSSYLQNGICVYYTSIYLSATLDMNLDNSDMTIYTEVGYDFAFGMLNFTPAFSILIPPAGDADYGLNIYLSASF